MATATAVALVPKDTVEEYVEGYRGRIPWKDTVEERRFSAALSTPNNLGL
jgi:hypothetical protein